MQHLVDGKLDDIAEFFLIGYGISNKDLDTVNFLAEIEVIIEVINDVVAIATANDIISVSDYLEFNINFSDRLVYDAI